MNFKQISDGNKWRWQWGNWVSTAHDFLEERPWTPLVITNKLCFSAKDNNKWSVIWGDSVGKTYDDVYDTVEFENKPLYIARNENIWFLVHENQESQHFDCQITYHIRNNQVLIERFNRLKNVTQEQHIAVWSF